MSINKKLGGIRLRLVTGITAALAICGVVLALNAPKPQTFDAEFLVDPVAAGEANAVLLVTGGNDMTTYYLRPKDLEASEDFEGWALEDVGRNGNGTSDEDPAIFDDDDSPSAIPFQTTNGEAVIYIKTVNVNEADDEKSTRMEIRAGSATSSTVIDVADLTLLEQ